MSWTILCLLVLGLGLAFLVALARQRELARMRAVVVERGEAEERGEARARLQHPVVDLSRCLGCSTCVAACPEVGVLDIVHGQAMVVNGGNCVGVGACARECPVDAIHVTLADDGERTDIPALSDLEAVGTPGLFLAGEVTAHALIKTAVDHGTAVAAEVARRLKGTTVVEGPEDEAPATILSLGSPTATPTAVPAAAPAPVPAPDPSGPETVDLCIVGAGPGGLACALEAKRLGLSFVLLDRESSPGGTIARYPRRKLVLTQPLELPLYGRFKQTTWEKEELVGLWERVVREQQLPVRWGERLDEVLPLGADGFDVQSTSGVVRSRCVCLALGRRGTPVTLGVPGEDLPKVAYDLLDAQSYKGRRVMVVGGGDSAAEAALALAEQAGNQVVLSYRGDSFWRLKSANRERLARAQREKRVTVVGRSTIQAITPEAVELNIRQPVAAATAQAPAPAAALAPAAAPAPAPATATNPDAAATGQAFVERVVSLPNDEVFIMAGGVPPFELLSRAGVSFDPADRPVEDPILEQGTGLVRALGVGLALAVATLLFAAWHADYYTLPSGLRAAHVKHQLLRPSLSVGLWLGIAATALIVVNLAYLARRAGWVRLGSLRAWMTSHVATGVLCMLCALLHAGMAPRETVGGNAFWALSILLVTGAIGRYLYAWVPRHANGRELELAEVKLDLGRMSEEWDQGQRQFREQVRREVLELVERRQWSTGFLGRVLALFGGGRELRRMLSRLAEVGREARVPDVQIARTLDLAKQAHRAALMTAHSEDLRSVLGTWRYLHRWVAALMVILVGLHIAYALMYGVFFFDEGVMPGSSP